jgi:hypothetical protein
MSLNLAVLIWRLAPVAPRLIHGTGVDCCAPPAWRAE